MLLQVDGSQHDWLEGRGPYLTLVAAIDDATGSVAGAVFREEEDAQGYFLMLREVISSKGVPLALYSDRHGIFQRSIKEPETLEEQLSGERQPTQFGRSLRELGIQAIFALSPQAKGRIERLFGTLQDRLVAELRLAGAATMEMANRTLQDFLPRFNERFGVPASQPGTAYRRPSGMDLASVLCFKYQRTVAADNTVRFAGRTLQLLPGLERPSYAHARVEVQERLDGSLVVSYRGDQEPQLSDCYLLGYGYVWSGAAERGSAICRQSLAANYQPQRVAQLARLVEREAGWERATALWREYGARYPADVALHQAYGYQAITYDAPLAVSELRHCIALAPRQAALHETLAWALERLPDAAEAQAEVRQALALEPTAARYSHLAGLLAQANQHDAVLSCLTTGLELFPDDEELILDYCYQLRVAYRREALQYLADAAQRLQSARLYGLAGMLGVQVDDVPAAWAAFQQYARLDPLSAAQDSNYLRCACLAAEYGALSQTVCTALRTASPEQTDAIMRQLAFSCDSPDSAARVFNELEARQPHSLFACRGYATALLVLRQWDTALAVIRRGSACTATPTPWPAWRLNACGNCAGRGPHCPWPSGWRCILIPM